MRRKLESRFPRIYKTCLDYNVDITTDLVPVRPAAHYAMGGVRTDLDGRTNLRGLFAAGEAACTGVHGANRLASNSLLEGLVFGARAAKAMREERRGHHSAAEHAAECVAEARVATAPTAEMVQADPGPDVARGGDRAHRTSELKHAVHELQKLRGMLGRRRCSGPLAKRPISTRWRC